MPKYIILTRNGKAALLGGLLADEANVDLRDLILEHVYGPAPHDLASCMRLLVMVSKSVSRQESTIKWLIARSTALRVFCYALNKKVAYPMEVIKKIEAREFVHNWDTYNVVLMRRKLQHVRDGEQARITAALLWLFYKHDLCTLGPYAKPTDSASAPHDRNQHAGTLEECQQLGPDLSVTGGILRSH